MFFGNYRLSSAFLIVVVLSCITIPGCSHNSPEKIKKAATDALNWVITQDPITLDLRKKMIEKAEIELCALHKHNFIPENDFQQIMKYCEAASLAKNSVDCIYYAQKAKTALEQSALTY